MGECSAVVSRTLQMGIPCIVNDLGWYAELPPFVEKLPTDGDRMQSMLNELLVRHARHATHHQQVCDAALRYAKEHVDFRTIVGRYRQLLRAFATTRACGANASNSAAA